MGLNKRAAAVSGSMFRRPCEVEFGTSGADREPGLGRYQEDLPGDARTRHRWDPDRRRPGRAVGRVGAVRRGGWVDHGVRVIGLIGYSVPVFWLGLMALVLFYAKLGWIGGPGRIVWLSNIRSSGSPVGCSSMRPSPANGRRFATPSRTGSSASLSVIFRWLHQPHDALVHAQRVWHRSTSSPRAPGFERDAHYLRHALRNAMVPLVTVVALSYAGLLEARSDETVFSWPGLGLYITHSLQNADMMQCLAARSFFGTIFIGLNLFPTRCIAGSTRGRRSDDRAWPLQSAHPERAARRVVSERRRPFPRARSPSGDGAQRKGADERASPVADERTPAVAAPGRARPRLRGVACVHEQPARRGRAAGPCWPWWRCGLREPARTVYAAIAILRTERLLPPSAAHWSAPTPGRDILSRLIHGSRITLYVVAPGGGARGADRLLVAPYRLRRWLARRGADAHHRFFSPSRA